MASPSPFRLVASSDMPPSDTNRPLLRTSQFNLRSLFALTFCLAVGLACGLAPLAPYEGWRELPGLLYEVLFASASAAVCIGLIQQVVFLSRSSASGGPLFFATGWRIVIVTLLILCLLIEMLVTRGYLTLPEQGNRLAVFYGLLIPEYLLYACLLVVLGEYRQRLLPTGNKAPLRRWDFVAIGIALFLSVLLILPKHLMMHFLVYIAMGGIEANQPLLYQRLGTYPDHHAEGFWYFWLSLAAIISLTVGTAIWFWLLCHWKRDSLGQRLAACMALALLVLSSWYGVWYYTKGLARISPEFIEAGFSGNWFDWIGAGIILVLLITAGAAWIARKGTLSIPLPAANSSQQRVFHENWIVLSIFVSSALLLGVELLPFLFPTPPVLWPMSFVEKIVTVLTHIDIYIPLALSLLSFQVLWLRWKFRSESQVFTVPVIDGRKFGVAWTSLALMLAIGVPVISAFCFAYWLGPWYLF